MNPNQTIEVLMSVICSLREQIENMEVNCTECVKMSGPCAIHATDQVIETLRLQMAKRQSTDPFNETSTTEPTVCSQ